MKLYIDTSSNTETTVILGERKLVKKSGPWRSQVVLPMILRLLKEKRSSWKDVSEIEICPGPGSFTGLRVGLAIASALGFALGVKVNGREVTELESVELNYDGVSAPTIDK